jgi:hypothetical protein
VIRRKAAADTELFGSLFAIRVVVVVGVRVRTLADDDAAAAAQVYAFEATTDEMGGDATTIFNQMRSHGFLAMGVGKLFHWAPLGFSFSYVEGSTQEEIGRYFPQSAPKTTSLTESCFLFFLGYEQEWGCSPDEPNGGTCTPCEAEDCNMGRIYLTDLPEENLFDYRVATEAHRLLGIASEAWHFRRQPSVVGIGFHHPHTK